MKILHVDLKTHRYPICVGPGLIADAGFLLRRQGFDGPPVVISNPTIMRLHGAPLLESLDREFGGAFVIKIGDGERFKNHTTLMKIYDCMFRAHADRRSWVLAFGGGIIGDMAGFAAATFMRGIPFVMVPTTLLAQVDSSIGGKVGLNVAQGKNLIGAFYQPSAVLSDTMVLKTLPKRELSAGLYEVIKCGAIRSKSLLRYLDWRLPDILKCRAVEMDHIVTEAARIKADVVALDEKESGLRMILNYGHTIGHAFEAAANYKRFKHGEAVAWGMMAALEFGRELGLPGDADARRLAELILRIGKLPPIKDLSFSAVWNALIRDKKFRSGDIRMVFLRRLGEAEIRSGVDSRSLRNFLKQFLAGSEHRV
jgi:3-dehydroquinate synthase